MPLDLPPARIALAAFGAYALWRGYRRYRRGRDNPLAPADPISDRWWRALFMGARVILADLLIGLALRNTIGPLPDPILWPLMAILAAATLTVFVAALVLGWRESGF